MAEYRISKDQFNVTDEGIIFLREGDASVYLDRGRQANCCARSEDA